MRKVHRYHIMQSQFREVLFRNEADLIKLVLAVDFDKNGFVELPPLSNKCAYQVAKRRVDQLYQWNFIDRLIQHIGYGSKCIMGSEVSKHGNHANDDREANAWVRQIEQAVQPPKRFKEKVYCGNERHDE